MKRCAFLAALPLIAAFAGLLSAANAAPPGATVVMSGLDNPRGLAFRGSGDDDDDDDGGRGGTLYVAEAGRGGSGPCVTIRGASECYGPTGAVSRLRQGVQRRIVTGLPSYAPQPSGTDATGPHDISVRGGTHVTVGLGLDPALRAEFGPGGADFGKLVRLLGNGQWRAVADLAAFEATANPGGGPADSNPYGLLSTRGSRLVAEAGGNVLLEVSASGGISTLAVFPSRPQGRATDSVPTAVERGPDGALYVGELTGVPFAAGSASIYRLVSGQAPETFLTGFTTIMDLAFAPDGTLYVLQLATGTGQSGPGALIRVERDGTRTTVLSDGLERPTSLVFGSRGELYISNRGTSAGTGEVVRVDVGEKGSGGDDD